MEEQARCFVTMIFKGTSHGDFVHPQYLFGMVLYYASAMVGCQMEEPLSISPLYFPWDLTTEAN